MPYQNQAIAIEELHNLTSMRGEAVGLKLHGMNRLEQLRRGADEFRSEDREAPSRRCSPTRYRRRMPVGWAWGLLTTPFRADGTVVTPLRRLRRHMPAVPVTGAPLELERDLEPIGAADLADRVVNSARRTCHCSRPVSATSW